MLLDVSGKFSGIDFGGMTAVVKNHYCYGPYNSQNFHCLKFKDTISSTVADDMVKVVTGSEQPVGCMKEKSQDMLIGMARMKFFLIDLTLSAGNEVVKEISIGIISGQFSYGGDQSDLKPKYSLFGSGGGGRLYIIDFITSDPKITGKFKGFSTSSGMINYGIKAIPASSAFLTLLATTASTPNHEPITIAFFNPDAYTLADENSEFEIVDITTQFGLTAANHVLTSVDMTSKSSGENPGILLISGWDKSDNTPIIATFDYQLVKECHSSCGTGKCVQENNAASCTECSDPTNYEVNPPSEGTCQMICDSSCSTCSAPKDAGKCTGCADSNYEPIPTTGGHCPLSCHSSCSPGKCTVANNPGKCTECKDKDNYKLEPSTEGTCLPICHSICKTCTVPKDATKCLECSDTVNYKLNGNTCELKCHESCKKCSEASKDDKCTECKEEGFKIEDDKDVGICVESGGILSLFFICLGLFLVIFGDK